MTTYSKGADAEALARSGRTLEALRSELTRIESSTRSAMRSICGNWAGENLLSLVRHFEASAAPGIQSCSRVLDTMSRRLEDNVRAQRGTSGLGVSVRGGHGASGGSSGSGGPGGGMNEVTKTKGTKFGLDAKKQDDSREDGEGSHYKHTTKDGQHRYETQRVDDEGRQRYDRWTHAGDHHGRPLEHESGWRTESERQVERRWLPTDDSADEDRWSTQHEDAAKWLERGAEGVSWAERTEHAVHSDYGKTYHDADGNVTDKEHAVRVITGGGPGTEAKGYHELGLRDGALFAGAGITAGAYLAKGSVEGNLGEHGRYTASGLVGSEAKADASLSLGKDGLAARAGAAAFVGAKGESGVSYDHGPFAGHAGASAMAGAEAKADASVGIGKDGVDAHAGASAFAGAKAGGELGAGVAGAGGTAGAEVYAGIGGHAGVDASLSASSVKVKVDVGAALGIGAGVTFSVDVQPKELISDVGLDDAATSIGGAIKDPIGSIGRLF